MTRLLVLKPKFLLCMAHINNTLYPLSAVENFWRSRQFWKWVS